MNYKLTIRYSKIRNPTSYICSIYLRNTVIVTAVGIYVVRVVHKPNFGVDLGKPVTHSLASLNSLISLQGLSIVIPKNDIHFIFTG
jgi:hypothetical protein